MTVHPGLRLTDDDLKAFEFFGQFDELPSKIRECIGKAVAEIRERRAADLAELPRWTPFISPDLVTLASECNHDRGDEDQAPSLPISTNPSRRSTL